MPGVRMQYLVSLVGDETPDELAAFLDDRRTTTGFELFERKIRSEWKRHSDKAKQNANVQKWTPPLLDNMSGPTKPGDTMPLPSAGANLPVILPVAPAPSVQPQAIPLAPEAKNLPEQAPLPSVDSLPVDPGPAAAAPVVVKPILESPPVPPLNPASSIAADKVAPPTPIPLIRARTVVNFRLRNARQSEPFREEITHEPADANIRLINVLIPDELGLVCNLKTAFIEGKPTNSGDFAFAVSYRFSDDPPEAIRTAKLALYVNADPKLLWKDLPSDRSDPLWKEDEAKLLICGAERKIIAARKRGRSHAHVGSCCDDDYYIQYIPDDGWYMAIVADGAGSAKYSRQGSRVAVRTSGNFLKQALSREGGEKVASAVTALQAAQGTDVETARRVLHNALYTTVGHAAHGAMKALFEEAQKRPDIIHSVKELSTTLLIGIARKFGSQWLCAAYWVGDGAVGVYQKDGSIELLGEVDAGEYSGQTRFLDANEVSQEALLKRTRFTLCDDFTAFILMTDGVSDPVFETEARLATGETWDGLWSDLETTVQLTKNDDQVDARLLDWLDFWSQGNHDDRTIAIIY